MESEVRALLGTLDRKHVQGILTALAEQDGAALMQQAAHLDERAPDYHQALGELSGAIQRMALLQALPDLPPGDDEDEDRLLAELAAKFAPEDVQLLYQIAINARRDLDYAPDARAGFEMALLRMLAFRPQGAPPMAAQPPASGRTAAARGVGAAVATRAAPVIAPSPASSAPLAADWDTIVTALGLQGTARHFATNCVMLERKAGVVRLRLDPAGESFRRPQIESRLAEALAQYFGEPVRLEITQAEAPGEILTPAKKDALAADDRQRAAEAAIESDPAVRAMRDVFGATVRPGSVKPLG
jgi:DNA polymerase-3 subunit gamma/tau